MINNKKGFSLLELLIYMSIFAILVGSLTAYMINILKIGSLQSSEAEVTSQLNSTMQKITQLVRASSYFEVTASSSLALRMPNPSCDNMVISLDNNQIQLSKTPRVSDPQNCDGVSSNLTTSNITVNSLVFSKTVIPGAHDQVTIDLQISSASQNPTSKITRTLHSAIARVSAATFDDNLIPGQTNSWGIGNSGSLWRSINDLIYFNSNTMGIGDSNITSDSSIKLQVSNGNLYINNGNLSGIILRDSNGAGCHKIIVTSGGAVQTSAVTCP